jgi:hypothetical protein
MTPQAVRAAMAEARDFLAKAETLLEHEKAEYPDETELKRRNRTIYGSKASGATRRASLDLTRALAEMRKP